MPAHGNDLYVFNPTDRGIFIEIYFPKKAAYQGAIYDALLEGYDPQRVKKRLRDAVREGKLLEELKDYPRILDPDWYRDDDTTTQGSAEERALQRIRDYCPPFTGWSMYSIDGVFFYRDETIGKDKPAEEAVQVVRLMFRFQKRDRRQKECSFQRLASDAGCTDVMRIILNWAITQYSHGLDNYKLWEETERQQFLVQHQHWQNDYPSKYKFAEEHFTTLVRATCKWIDDCALFIFGYLVRKFSQKVLKVAGTKAELEDEIWVTNFFDMGINIIAPQSVD